MVYDAVWEFRSDNAEDAMHCRHEFEDVLGRVGRYDVFSSTLIYGELVSNVIKHAPGPIRVRLRFDHDDAVLTVQDYGVGFVPQITLPADLFAESGRGLCIVQNLSRDLTVEISTNDGTRVSVILPFTHP